MIKPEQIPDAAVDAAIDAMLKADDYYVCGDQARAAIAAAINAWPRACRIDFDDLVEMVEGEIVLPAPEKSDG